MEQRAAALQDIEDEGTRLHRLIENMLLLARVEGAVDYEPEPVLLQRMLPRIAEQLKLRVPGLEVELHLDPALPTASAQPGYIEQVVQNLVGNAVKYSGGALRVEITATHDGPWIRVAVEDRGTGITDEEASQVSRRSSDRSGHRAARAASGWAGRSASGWWRCSVAASGPNRGPAAARRWRSRSRSKWTARATS